MKHYLLLAIVVLSLLLPTTATARPLRPGWRVIPGGVQRCVYDAQVRRDVCTTHCNVGYQVKAHKCVKVGAK